MLVLEESRRVSGTYKVVLIVLTYMGVSRGSKEIRDFFVVEAVLFNFAMYECLVVVFDYICVFISGYFGG